MLDDKTMEKLSELSKISFTVDEIQSLSSQLGELVEFLSKIKSYEGNEEMNIKACAVPYENLRDDIASPSYSPEEMLANADGKKGNFFAVPKVVE